MKKLLVMFIFCIFGFVSTAQAIILDFEAMADSDGPDTLAQPNVGESIWDSITLDLGGDLFLTITATYGAGQDEVDAFVYFDWDDAGLGVCKAPGVGVTINDENDGSKANECLDRSDDNLEELETLYFAFTNAANESKEVQFDAFTRVGHGDPVSSYFGGVVQIGTMFTVAHDGTDRYITGASIEPGRPGTNVNVPEPGTVAIFALGLFGLVASRRKSARL
ncbi:PEP-CTERM sorting domain-containing protein [Thalassotalea crassostreae]|uniref:PEP-CTERM sorting domain-containing protein n=1 Tax=Thalassotalea crassostreae TaxID=1763536 RepID=UPI000837FDEF|nr:PEP-CTERM sorting domain-containing protein [Thalassotalea crassostreae]